LRQQIFTEERRT